jgi:hypothetical protein
VPTVVADGNGVFINENNVPTLVFFEGRKQTEAGLQADVVAAVRMGSVADLEALQQAITETIEKHKTREK